MRRGRKHVTGVRRDDGVRVIRSSEVRYPGINLPPVENLADDGTIIDPERRLAPAGRGVGRGWRPGVTCRLARTGRRRGFEARKLAPRPPGWDVRSSRTWDESV